MRLIDADAIRYDQLLNTGNKEQPLEWAVSHSQIDNMPTIDAVPLEDFKSMERTVDKLTKAIADAEPAVRCKDCKWFDKEPGGTYGYCHAAKHGFYSQHWEISIYRTYKEDFYCADGERREE